MNETRAKWLLIGGLSALAIAFAIELYPTGFIAPAGIILLGLALIAGGVISIIIATTWHLVNFIRNKSSAQIKEKS
jgi:uncharacterized membrane protein